MLTAYVLWLILTILGQRKMIPGFRDGRRYIMVPFKIASAVINAMFTRLNTLAYAIGEKRKQEKIQAAKN